MGLQAAQDVKVVSMVGDMRTAARPDLQNAKSATQLMRANAVRSLNGAD
jgi:hypothetical protein